MQNRPRLIIFIGVIALIVLMIFGFTLPPREFPVGVVVEIPTGSSTSQIGEILYQNKAIQSAFFFNLFAQHLSIAEKLQAGFYQFEKPLMLWQVIARLESGKFSGNPVKLTVPEGLSIQELADLVDHRFSNINPDQFVTAASPYAGFLFPETYFLPPEIETGQLLKLMRKNFDQRTVDLEEEIEKSGRTLDEIVNMAALVEAEVKTKEDRALVAGILWKRLDQKMRLEVDVATSTYEQAGLPEAPIVSPGLESIEATLHPKTSPYLFYLSDKNGKIHYARTFDEHKQNIAKYLKK